MSILDGLRKFTQPFDEADEDFFEGENVPVDNEPTIIVPHRERVPSIFGAARTARETPAEPAPRDPFLEAAVSEPARRPVNPAPASNYVQDYLRELEQPMAPRGGAEEDPVVNIHTTTAVQVVLSKPTRFEQAAEVADHLHARRTVVLNLENAPKEECRRLLDFLSGVAYANGGKIKKVAINTYIITPYNVDIMGDIIDELENSGVSFY